MFHKSTLSSIILLLISSIVVTFAQNESSPLPLTYQMNADELARKGEIGMYFRGTAAPVSPVTNIAEFQPSQGVLVRYPFGIPVSLVREMSQLVMVTTSVSSNYQEQNVTNTYRNAGVNMDNVNFINAATDSYWTRDYGPWVIIDGNDEFGVVDFIYNRPRHNDDAHAEKMANFLDINYFSMDMEHTGGNYMTDGYGTAASTDLVLQENSDMSLEEIEQMSLDYLGIGNYLFTIDPLGDYIAHIDCWGKFLAVDKVMISQVAESDSRYEAYESVADFFANSTTPWGNKYRVYRVYAPGGVSNATPYTNCLILNDHVFVPQTGNSLDEDAIITYQNAMPGYTIVPVQQSSSTPWLNTDALHCRTHEIPDLGMLLIRHYPTLGAQPYQPEFTLQADITAYSQQTIYSDSVLIYYRITDAENNTTDWLTAPMTCIGGKTWEGTIPGIQDTCQVEYYLFAADQSNRREKHPYIGAFDPHIFTVAHNPQPNPDGIAQYANLLFKVYPNPAQDQFTVKAPTNAHLCIYNTYGQIVSQCKIAQEYTSFDCSQWSSGTYFIKIITLQGEVAQDRIVICH